MYIIKNNFKNVPQIDKLQRSKQKDLETENYNI